MKIADKLADDLRDVDITTKLGPKVKVGTVEILVGPKMIVGVDDPSHPINNIKL